MAPENIEEFEMKMQDRRCTKIGTTTDSNNLVISSGNETLVDVDIDIALKAWKSTFCGEEF